MVPGRKERHAEGVQRLILEAFLFLAMYRMAPVSLGVAKEYGPKVDALILNLALKLVKR
jgi:hypothetical protein